MATADIRQYGCPDVPKSVILAGVFDCHATKVILDDVFKLEPNAEEIFQPNGTATIIFVGEGDRGGVRAAIARRFGHRSC